MTSPPSMAARHLLLYEPRTEGHHLPWLRMIVEDLLSANFRLSLAVDQRPGAEGKIREHLSEFCPELALFNAYNEKGRRHADGKAASVAYCLAQSGADHVFLCVLDEIASSCFRRAAFGIRPPPSLRGKMGGIYHRSRFMVASRWSINRLLKERGFRRLIGEGWFRQILLTDEYLVQAQRAAQPEAPILFLPDPCPADFSGSAEAARRELGVPLDKRVFLFYGTAQPRKGLHLAVQALKEGGDARAFLLCAGHHQVSAKLAGQLESLCREKKALWLNRYVSSAEEKLCFEASDVLLLPYLNHFGCSSVLSRGMAAGKMVIASKEQLLGRLVREYGLGLLFPSGNVGELRACLRRALAMSSEDLAVFAKAAKHYTQRYSRAAFRGALLGSLEH